MKKATILLVQRLSCMPNQSPGTQDVIEVLTTLAPKTNNAFYIDPNDLKNIPIALGTDHPSLPGLEDPLEMNTNDLIEFDLSDGLFHKAVLWKGRKIRQHGYSFDYYDNTSNR